MQRGPEGAFRYIAGDIAARDRQTVVGECPTEFVMLESSSGLAHSFSIAWYPKGGR